MKHEILAWFIKEGVFGGWGGGGDYHKRNAGSSSYSKKMNFRKAIST